MPHQNMLEILLIHYSSNVKLGMLTKILHIKEENRTKTKFYY